MRNKLSISIKIILIIALTGSVIYPVSAQFIPSKVEKSSEKIVHQGKVYYVHKVKPGQTLHSISRAYGVTEQDIANANPSVVLEVIKVGQILKIPEVSGLDKHSEEYYGLTEDDFIYHTVQPKETPYFLHKKYNVPLEIIYKYNPGTDHGLQIGQIVRIPRKHVLEKEQLQQYTDTINQLFNDMYEVKTGETLYSIAKSFGVSVADIVAVNKELRWGLKAGQMIRIPDKSGYGLADTIRFIYTTQNYSETTCDSIESNYNPFKEIKIALMLPYFAYSTINGDTTLADTLKPEKPVIRGRGSLEFYEGFLMAIDSLKKTGLNITIFNYDTEADTVKTKEILDELDYIEPQIIFGPIAYENVKIVNDFAARKGIVHVQPFTRNPKILTKNMKGFQMIPSTYEEMLNYADYISNFYDWNIILLHKEDSIGYAQITQFKEKLFNFFTFKSKYNEAIYKEIRISDSLNIHLRDGLRKEMKNLILVFSQREADVSSVIRELQFLSGYYDLELFGLSVWRNFQSVRVELLHELKTTIYLPFYIDYTSEHTKSFINKARNILGYEPYRTVGRGIGFNYTYLGYESCFYFVNAFRKYGSEFTKCIEYYKQPLLQSDYNFVRPDAQSGYVNSTISIIKYDDDYDVKQIDYQSNAQENRKTIPGIESIECDESTEPDELIKRYFNN